MKGGLDFLIPSPSAEGHFFCPKNPPCGRAFWGLAGGHPLNPLTATKKLKKVILAQQLTTDDECRKYYSLNYHQDLEAATC